MLRRWIGGLTVGLASLLLVAPGAHADDGAIVVDQPPEQHLGTVRAGDVVTWRIGAYVTGADRADLALQLRTWGPLVEREDGLLIQVDACDQGRTVCDRRILDRAPLRDVATRTSSDTWRLKRLRGDAPMALEVELSLPASATDITGLDGQVAVGLFASGDLDHGSDDEVPDNDDPPEDELALTGVAVGSLVALAIGLIATGSAMRAPRREKK